MKLKSRFIKTSIKRVPKDAGISIEERVRQAIATNKPIEGNAPMIYTPAKDGVNPAYDCRTDKQDLALDAMDKYQASDRMRTFMAQTEVDADGYDGAGNKVDNTNNEPKE